MLLPKSHRTFGKIAELWAEENAGKVDAADRDEILSVFYHALRNDEFGHAELTIWRHTKYVLQGEAEERQEAGWRLVTRDMLDQTLFRGSAQYDEHTKKQWCGWLEGLRIAKEPFGRWCDEQDISRPQFWFDDGDGTDDLTRSGMPGKPSPKRLYLTDASRAKGGSTRKYDVGLQQFINQLFAEFTEKSIRLARSGLTAWLEQNALPGEGYDPEPPIPDCGDIEFYENRVWWKNRQGHPKSASLRTIERYILRAKDPASSQAT